MHYIKSFLKLVLPSAAAGILGGIAGGAFRKTLDTVTAIDTQNSILLYFLPLAGLLIVFLYKLMKLSNDPGTNAVVVSGRTGKKLPLAMAPLIFVCTSITHLFGGSAGREGAALQLGGVIGSGVSRLFKSDNAAILVMCGMSAVFAAAFGTPITAVVFTAEIVGSLAACRKALAPCFIAAYFAAYISSLYGNAPVSFTLSAMPGMTWQTMLSASVLGACCAAVSIAFCLAMQYGGKYSKRLIKNDYIRVFAGGCLVILLTAAVGTRDYNGAGMSVIKNAIGGNAHWYAFLLKIIFTAVTVGFGFKGGEIVPSMFVGATFGCAAAPILGLPAPFAAAVGLTALFAGVVNAPVAATVLAAEIFGAQNLPAFAAACFICYALSSKFGLYTGADKIAPITANQ